MLVDARDPAVSAVRDGYGRRPAAEPTGIFQLAPRAGWAGLAQFSARFGDLRFGGPPPPWTTCSLKLAREIADPPYRAAFSVAEPRRSGSTPDRYRRNWHTAALPPLLEPISTAGVRGGTGWLYPEFAWRGRSVSYLAYLAPGMLAYTAFMTAFFQALFAAYIRMHYQKTWEGQLVTQLRLEHVVWGEVSVGRHVGNGLRSDRDLGAGGVLP